MSIFYEIEFAKYILPYRDWASAEPNEFRARSHEDPAIWGRAAEHLPGQEPARAAARAKPADPQGSIFRHFGVQSPK